MTAVTINLLPRARVAALRRRQRIRAWVLALVGYIIVLAMLWSAFAAGVPVSGGAEEVAAAQARLDSVEGELARLRKLSIDLQSRIDLADSVADHPDWSLLLAVVADARRDEIAVERLQVAGPGVAPPPRGRKPDAPVRGPWTFVLGGAAPSQRAASDFVERLERLGVFDSVTLRETRERSAGGESGGVVDFTVACTLGTANGAGGKNP